MDESIVREFEQQQVGKLKLSQAIRIGAQIRPQCRGAFRVNGASCAVGAALEAVGASISDDIHQVFPALDQCAGDVYRMNDQGWTREQIADWLESQGL